MILSAAVLVLFLYGYVAVYFTHSQWFAIGFAAVLWWLHALSFLHRNEINTDEVREQSVQRLMHAVNAVANGTALADAAGAAVRPLQQGELINAEGLTQALVRISFIVPSTIILGAVLAGFVVWSFQLVPLLDPVPWHVLRRATAGHEDVYREPVWLFNPSTLRFLNGFLLFFTGLNFLVGSFGAAVSGSIALALGVLFFIIGAALLVYTLLRWYKSDRPSDWFNFGYAIAFVAFILVSHVYIDLINIRPHQGWLFQLALFALVLIVILLSWRAFSRLTEESREKLAYDPRYSVATARPMRQLMRWLAFWVPLALVFIVGWIVDERTQNAGQVFLFLVLSTIVFGAIILAWGYWRWMQPAYATQRIFQEDMLDYYTPTVNIAALSVQQVEQPVRDTAPTLTHRVPSGAAATILPVSVEEQYPYPTQADAYRVTRATKTRQH